VSERVKQSISENYQLSEGKTENRMRKLYVYFVVKVENILIFTLIAYREVFLCVLC
jgi:hypothetical protein